MRRGRAWAPQAPEAPFLGAQLQCVAGTWMPCVPGKPCCRSIPMQHRARQRPKTGKQVEVIASHFDFLVANCYCAPSEMLAGSENAGHRPNLSLTSSRISLIMSGRSGSAHSPAPLLQKGGKVTVHRPFFPFPWIASLWKWTCPVEPLETTHLRLH